ncbi:hypothetical protein SESBI_28725 [Sesbania bispinosa]|nr:hypothetical protein SESBI_28725 [Sesbania bispinosa]
MDRKAPFIKAYKQPVTKRARKLIAQPTETHTQRQRCRDDLSIPSETERRQNGVTGGDDYGVEPSVADDGQTVAE